ncbi:uncharacterized protein N7496_002197 [Penicillium cataractarum]|uniref:Exonuclease domain-containing protein n=1 Tax=Penicillium cataractarum TaxID=2100454 RepID=A0A9W9SLA2_9EURO|nr:uncharacterized protein N7496_002197 [Penicillium cataractarum]KAJ5379769.1 hypothetical protein N7496_002197 [Penicillium cataractarum]
MVPKLSRQPGIVTNGINLIAIRDTPQERADLNSFVLDWDQRKKQGIRSSDFKRITSESIKIIFDQEGERYEIDEAAEERSMLGKKHRIGRQMAFRTQIAEDLEWALLARQRLAFMERTKVDNKETNKEEDLMESPSAVAKYYLCPHYVVPDPESSFDYSEFTASDEPIWHRPGPAGTTRHFQSRIKLRMETGDAGWYDAELTEAEYQEYLRGRGQRLPGIWRTGPCNIHPRGLREGKYACCGLGKLSTGCTLAPEHKNAQTLQELEKKYKLFETPFDCPQPRECVVLDCEMGVASTGESELVRVTAVDYFSGQTLIDALVFPTARLLHPNTRYPGVTWQMMHEAKRARRAILGRDAARRRYPGL